MPKAKITSKGQITIPKKIREMMNLKTGDVLHFEHEGDRTILRSSKKSFREAAGCLHREGQKPVSVEEMDQGITEYLKKKYSLK